MATTDRLLYISSDGLVRQLGFDPTAADLGGAAGIASSTHAATSKTTPVDADEFPFVDSAASWSLKKLTWANLKATLKTYFDTLYMAVGTPTGGLTVVTVSTTSQTATAGNHYVLTNVAATTLTLPASPASGDTVACTPANSLATNIIARNGQTIMGLSEDMTLDDANATVTLRFLNSTWRLI